MRRRMYMKKYICLLVSAVISVSTVFSAYAKDDTFPFIDIARNSWYYSYIDDTYDKGIMAGISDNIFGPDETLTRAMAASLVYRMYGSPDVTYKALFPDVPDGEWYTDGIIWAKENGVKSGYDDGMFCPDWYMTIEQFASIFYRLSGSPEVEDAEKILNKYSDGYRVSGYAKEAMAWAVQNNMLQGDTLHPTAAVTRAEAAKMLSVFTTINDYHIIKNLGSITAYIRDNYDSTFDMTDYSYSTEENDDDIYLYYMVGNYRSTFGYHIIMTGDKLVRVDMIGKMNPYFLSTDLTEPSITDEELLKMAVEADNLEYTVKEQHITKYFNMDNMKYTFEVETTYVDENGDSLTKLFTYEI